VNSSSIILTGAEAKNPVLHALSAAYRDSKAGSTGQAGRAFSIRYEKLVHDRACADVYAERSARAILSRLESAGILRFTRKPLAREKILSVFVEDEILFFEALGETPPARQRLAFGDELSLHLDALDGHPYAAAWKQAIKDAIADIANGRSADGLPNTPIARNEVLRATAAVLHNQTSVSLRRLGAEKLNDSKLIGERREAIERFMTQFLPPELCSLEAWSVIDFPPKVELCGPIGVETDTGKFVWETGPGSPYTITDEILSRAVRVFTSGSRCLCVENRTPFLEAAAANPRDLIVHTSYPSSAVVKLLKALPANVCLQHWGDTDPWGYDILRVLRQKTGRAIEAVQMCYRPCAEGKLFSRRETAILERLLQDPLVADVKTELIAMRNAGNKGKFEQESLSPPCLLKNK
jgi:hypothetical protein